MADQQISLGRIVHYALSNSDVQRASVARASRNESHIGAAHAVGDLVPLIITHVFEAGVNGQAFLDGNDTLWIVDAPEGAEMGTWRWPELVTATAKKK